MPFNLEKFKADYDRWVEENLSDWTAGNAEKAIKSYPLVESEDVPWTLFTGDPSEKTVALITSGGLYLKDSQPAFDAVSIHGDPSFREIPKTVSFENLGISHGHYDPSLAEQDFNTIFPIHRFIELEQEGVIGKLADTHYSFSYVNDVYTFLTETVPEVINRIKSGGIDLVFLVPV